MEPSKSKYRANQPSSTYLVNVRLQLAYLLNFRFNRLFLAAVLACNISIAPFKLVLAVIGAAAHFIWLRHLELMFLYVFKNEKIMMKMTMAKGSYFGDYF